MQNRTHKMEFPKKSHDTPGINKIGNMVQHKTQNKEKRTFADNHTQGHLLNKTRMHISSAMMKSVEVVRIPAGRTSNSHTIPE